MAPDEPHNTPAARPGIRWWPAWMILILGGVALAVIRLAGDAPYQTRNLRSTVAVLVMLALIVLWWMLLSRARWRIRFLGLLGAILVLGAPALLFRIRGVSGDLVPILEPRWARQAPSVPIAKEPPRASESRGSSSDFPQFQGPQRNGVLSAPALARDWNATPPTIAWKQPIGAAWSGFAVVGSQAVTQEQQGEEELVTCYDSASGRRLWTHSDASRYATTIAGEGPRATPTIVGDHVFTLGANGLLNCLDLASSRRIWGRDLRKDAEVNVPGWGFASSPLVHEGRVIVSAGGHTNRSLMAYSIADGAVAWTGGDRPVNYSSPALLDLAGMRQIVMFNGRKITSHAAESGVVLWEYPWGIGQPHVALPVPVGTNGLVFSSGYGVGAELIELARGTNGVITPRQVWKSIRLKSKFANYFHRGGFIYGLDDGVLVCVDTKDGSLRWKEGRYGHGQMLWVVDLLLIMAESGELVLLAPGADAPHELSRFRVFGGKTWNPPALAGEWLFVRNDLEAACVKLPILPTSGGTAGSPSGPNPNAQ